MQRTGCKGAPQRGPMNLPRVVHDGCVRWTRLSGKTGYIDGGGLLAASWQAEGHTPQVGWKTDVQKDVVCMTLAPVGPDSLTAVGLRWRGSSEKSFPTGVLKRVTVRAR